MRYKLNLSRKPALALMLLATLLVPAAAQQQAADKLLDKGDEYISLGKPSQARAEYEKALKAGAKLQDDFSRSRNLGFAYLNGNPHDFAKASQWLGNASRLHPADEEVMLGLAQALSWSGNPTAALQPWRTLCEKNPQNTDFALGLANALWASGNRSECFAQLQRMVEASPSNVALRLEYARFLGYARDFPAASVQYESVLQMDPTNLDAQVGSAKLLSWQQSYASSIEKYDQVLKINPRYYTALVGKAYSLLWMGKDEEARKYFQMAYSQNPRDPDVATPLRKLNAAAERTAKAQEAANKKTELANNATSTVAPAEEKPTAETPTAEPAPSEPASTEPESTPAPDPVEQLMAEADGAAAQSNYSKAIGDYRKVLAIAPDNQEASLRLARTLSWAKEYDASIDQYGKVLGNQKAQSYQTRLERARVLSWAQKYDESIREYQALSSELGANAVGNTSANDVRIELARVESWAKQYDQSLAEISKVVPKNPTTADVPALLLRARVLAYKQRYSQSIATYNQVLQLQPHDQEARFGKAQSMYWSGDLSRSRPMLRTIVADEPANADARLALASVEHGTGNSSKAITLLDTLPQNGEVKKLRTAIEESMRPVWRERFGYQNDIETPTDSSLDPTTVRSLRLTSSYEFSVKKDLRVEVSNTLIHGDTSNSTLGRYGQGSFAQESMFSVTFHPAAWLRLTAGAGVGTSGHGYNCSQPVQAGCVASGYADRVQRPLYEVHPVVTVNKLRLEFESSRHISDYTPLAVHDNVVQLRQVASVNYDFEYLRVGGEYRYQNYKVVPGDKTPGIPSELSANSHGGTVYVTPRLYRNDRVTIEAGMRYDAFGFDDGAEAIGRNIPSGYGTAGFFAPRLYERYAGTGHIAWVLPSKVNLDLSGTVGPQRIFGFAALNPPPTKWGTTGTAAAQISRNFGRFQPFMAYEFFTTETAGGPTLTNGSYASHALAGGFSFRF